MVMMDGVDTLGDVDVIAEHSRPVLDEDPAVLFAYLFGSLARGTAGPLSDIDIAVCLKEETDFAEEKLDLCIDIAGHIVSNKRLARSHELRRDFHGACGRWLG